MVVSMILFICLLSFSLQKFKLGIANTVIGQDNSSLHSMNTSDLLDLFQVSGSQHQWNKVLSMCWSKKTTKFAFIGLLHYEKNYEIGDLFAC